jgi:hypothetical protein
MRARGKEEKRAAAAGRGDVLRKESGPKAERRRKPFYFSFYNFSKPFSKDF